VTETRGTVPLLRITLFGPCDVRVNGKSPLRLRSRKGSWLLALLVLRNGSGVERRWLAGTLWPESAEAQASANLRNSLKDLRRALGPEARRLRAPTPRTLCLDLEGAEADLPAFDAAIACGSVLSLERAVALYRGPLLAECDEEWAFQERQAREQAYLTALERIAADALVSCVPAKAEGFLRRAVAVDPLRESTQRSLMQALVARGSAGAALRVYQELRLLLRQELHVEPDPETTALYQQVQAQARRAQECGPSPSLSECRTNLPAPVTPLIGREREIADACGRLRCAEVRLFTLTGPGGTGKTRLGLQVATELLDAFVDGVYFVSLAPLRDPKRVASTLAQALGVRETDSRPVTACLKAHLRERHLLLLLDNFEHVIGAAPLVAELLASCPRLKLLVTSRMTLHLQGEHEFPVSPLALPDRRRLPPEELLSRYAAIALFLQRALAVKPDFAITSENAPAVAEICCRLDGLPLAIELAAARIKLLPPQALLSCLFGVPRARGSGRTEGSSLRLLVGGPRDLPARQQTLRNTIAWSYGLLGSSEKRPFRRLSVFVGGCGLDAAAAICWQEGDRDDAILAAVTSLVHHSLLRPDVDAAGEPRFGMLETIREYGQECLVESGEWDAVRRRHAEYYLALAEAAEPKLTGPDQVVWMDRLEQEHDNLRAALEYLVETGDSEAGLRLGGALHFFWLVRGYLDEGRARMARLLDLPVAPEAAAARAKVLQRSASLAWRQGDYTSARAVLEESLSISRELDDPRGIAESLGALGYCVLCLGEVDAAGAYLSECLAISRQLGDQWGIAGALGNLGHIALDRGDHETARAFYEEGLAIRREMGNRHGIAASLQNLGTLALARGDATDARARYSEALTLNREVGNRPWEAVNLIALGEVACAQGDLEMAQTLCEEGLAISRELGDRAVTADALNTLGRIACRQDDYQTAGVRLKESLALCRHLAITGLVPQCLEGCAAVAQAQGQSRRAARLFGAAEALRDASPAPRPAWVQAEHERRVAVVRAGLGEEAFAAAWAVGRAMTLAEAVSDAAEER
jgi:predicted ATPase/DNA-binding SARP family transcriptional activator/Tfp pilus assembly protein PilF